MKAPLANFLSSGEITWVVIGSAVAAGLAGWGVHMYLKSRPTPAELERRRRSALHKKGKMADATLVEYKETIIMYSYAVGGVHYTASQDLADLQSVMPAEMWKAIGPVSVKYDPRNPANSIVVSEEWNGLRITEPRT